MNNLIEAKNVYKSFMIGKEKLNILKNVSLQVEAGEFISIMGPSGCGKSTLLYLLGGLDTPTSGSISILNKQYTNMSERKKILLRRRTLGFVFQFYNLVPNLNVEDNILLPLLLDGKKARNYKKKLNDILELMGLSTRKSHTPRELSGGQQQRVSIARALIFDPDIVLADEPIGNLDSKAGNEIMKLFKAINSEMNKTIVQVTHSEEAASYGTQIINLKDGEIVQSRDLSSLTTHTAN